MQDQRGHADGGEDAADVDLGVPACQRQCGAGTRTPPEIPSPPPPEVLVVLGPSRQQLDTGGTAPVQPDVVVELLAFLIVRSPRVIRAPDALRIGTVHDQRPGPLGIGRGEERADGTPLGAAEQGGLLRADGVHHGLDVLDALLEGGNATNPVRESRAALVEEDQAREGRQPAQEPGIARLVPVLLDIRDPAGDVHEVDRAAPHHLVGDADLADLRVSCLRDIRLDGGTGAAPPGACRGSGRLSSTPRIWQTRVDHVVLRRPRLHTHYATNLWYHPPDLALSSQMVPTSCPTRRLATGGSSPGVQRDRQAKPPPVSAAAGRRSTGIPS